MGPGLLQSSQGPHTVFDTSSPEVPGSFLLFEGCFRVVPKAPGGLELRNRV